MPATVDIGTLLYKDPAMHGGRPCITGTGTTVLAVVYHYDQGLTAEEIVEQLPSLSLEGVFAALAYATANRAEIEGYFQEDEDAEVEWIAANAARSRRVATG